MSSLRVAVTGAADIQVELIRRMKSELPFRHIMTGYGLAAKRAPSPRPAPATPSRTSPPPSERHARVSRVRVTDDGEVLVRGYGVMRGYLDDPQATAEAVDADGWLHTGDLGTLDDAGRLRIVGRKKDMFIVGGFNAYPAEIEGYLMEHPPWRRPRSSGCRTTGWARSTRRSWSPAGTSRRTS
ncbi:hypothetical protein ACU686_27435 [Yinghuangia aomiensis]